MIQKKYKVPRQLIPYLLEKGQSYTTKLFIIRYNRNEEKFSRYRVIISKKIHSKAVKRNHLRRQVYEAIRINILKENIKPRDLILIPKKNILKAKYAEIEADIKNITNG